MATTIRSRKQVDLEPVIIIGLGICPALAATKGLSEALLLASGLITVQLCTIAILALLSRFVVPSLSLFFTLTVAGGCTAVWTILCQALAPDLFASLALYAYLTPAMLPVVYSIGLVRHTSTNKITPLRCIAVTVIVAGALCLIAALREFIGAGTLLAQPVLSGPLFAWVQTTPGVLTIAAFITGCAALIRSNGAAARKADPS